MGNQLKFSKLLAFKSSDVTAAWINLIMMNYLSFYASDTLGVNIGVVGTLLLASKIVDGFTDILAGWLVDNTHTRLGKGRPYELCIFGMTICTVLLFSASPAWSDFLKCAWIFCMYTLTFSVFSTLRNAGANAYMIRTFSNNPVVLKKVASYGGIITMGGSMLMSIVFPIMLGTIATSAAGWQRLILIVMVAGAFIGVFRFVFCKEDPSVDAASGAEKVHIKEILLLFRRNKYVWIYAAIMLSTNVINSLAVGSYYFKWIVGDVKYYSLVSVMSFVLIPLMIIFPKIMEKLGSMCKMLSIFACIGIAGYIVCFLSGEHLPGVLIGVVLGCLGTLPINYYGILFIMNICTYNEMIGLPRMDSSSNILSNFAAKVGGAMGGWVTGMLLMLSGYVSQENVAAQPESALMMIRVDFAIVPAILLGVILLCCLAFSKLEGIVSDYEAKKKK